MQIGQTKSWIRMKASSFWEYYILKYRTVSFGSGRVLLLSCLVGILAAIGAIFFQVSVDVCKHLFLHQMVGLPLEGPAGEISLFAPTETTYRWWLLLIVPTLGGLVSGILVYRYAPEAKGHGTDGVIDAYHFRRGIIRPIVPLIKTIASAITIGTGGSAGKEGPIAQIAAGTASIVGQRFKLSTRHMRVMVIAGLAAGIGATFRAPLAAGLFAAEVLYREMDFDRDVIMPALVSPIIAYAVFRTFFQAGPLFATPNLAFEHSWELIPFTIVALAVGIGARGFVFLFDKCEMFFENLKIPEWTKPALGGLAVGVIGLVAPLSISESYGTLQMAHFNQLAFGSIVLLIFAKAATTSLTIGSGGSGGVFGPSIVIGGLIGGMVGMGVSHFVPVSQSAYVIVGMAGFFSACANTPISTIFMVSEMTGSYSLLVPTMWVSSLTYIMGRGFTLYKKQLWNHYEAPAQLEELRATILRKMTVGEACHAYDSLQMVQEKTPLSDLDERSVFDQQVFGVLNKKGFLIGEISRQSIRYARNLSQRGVIASDLMERVEFLSSDESLWSAMQKMLRQKREQLFVVTQDQKPLSILKKQDILAAYDRRMSGLDGKHSDQSQAEEDQKVPVSLKVLDVQYDKPCSNQEELLRFLGNLLAPNNPEKAESYFKALLEREELGSTAMGHKIALPHPHRREVVDSKQGIYIITTQHPIPYHSPDRLDVDTFVLFWFGDAHHHIEALAQVAKGVHDGRLMELIKSKAPADAFESLFESEPEPSTKSIGQDT